VKVRLPSLAFAFRVHLPVVHIRLITQQAKRGKKERKKGSKETKKEGERKKERREKESQNGRKRLGRGVTVVRGRTLTHRRGTRWKIGTRGWEGRVGVPVTVSVSVSMIVHRHDYGRMHAHTHTVTCASPLVVRRRRPVEIDECLLSV